MKYLDMCALEHEPMGLVIFPFHRVINLERQLTNLQATQNHVTPMADHEMQKIARRSSDSPTPPPACKTMLVARVGDY